MIKILKLEKVSLRTNTEITEKIIQNYIYNDPSVLGLGDLQPVSREKVQPTGGRIDILLRDENNMRYEVELQLGSTDPSHIIRTIEYWDMERKRYPQYDHVAVIIAEEVTGRFLNVISLFNGNIPIIALQLNAFILSNNEYSLVFTKVLDRIVLGTDEDDTPEPTDRKYWEKKASRNMLSLMDSIFSEIFGVTDTFKLNYNKFYIGLTKDGVSRNFVAFVPKKQFMYIRIKCPVNEQIKNKLEESGLEVDYITREGSFRIKFNKISDYESNANNIKELIDNARSSFNV